MTPMSAKTKESRLTVCVRRDRKARRQCSGQAAVEFALVLTVAMIVLFVSIQLALIGEAALALGQMNYQGARYAAVNTCATGSEVATYMLYVGSPTVTTPSSCGSALTIQIADSTNNQALSTASGSSGACSMSTAPMPTQCTGTNPQRTFGSPVTVSVSFNVVQGNLLFLGQSFMGVSFQSLTTLKSTETAMAE